MLGCNTSAADHASNYEAPYHTTDRLGASWLPFALV